MPELTWPAKSLRSVPPARLQVESRVYPAGAGGRRSPGGRLFLGENLAVMTALLPAYEGRIRLIYADPPFFTNKAYPARVGRGEDSRRPQDWALAEGYADRWHSLDDYLDFLYQRLHLMRRLLAPDGMLFLHLDWHADAYARLLLDELFGSDALVNQIVWTYHGPSPIRRAFNRKHDIILAYARGANYVFNADAVRQPYDPVTVRTFSSPRAGFGKVPDLARGKVPEDWWYFPVVARLHAERTGYPTQKPLALLERIVLACSNPGDLVADFFCGSGTTAVVAARTGRSFLCGDLAWRALHVTRCRLVATPSAPFTLERSADVSLPRSRRALRIHRDGRVVTLAERDLAQLDYWEAGRLDRRGVFLSLVQGVRPLREGTVPPSLTLPASVDRVHVRAVFADGTQAEVIV